MGTDPVSLYVGYSYTQGVPGAGVTAKPGMETNTAAVLEPAIEAMYKMRLHFGMLCTIITVIRTEAWYDERAAIPNDIQNNSPIFFGISE